jgi:hypothetical protein
VEAAEQGWVKWQDDLNRTRRAKDDAELRCQHALQETQAAQVANNQAAKAEEKLQELEKKAAEAEQTLKKEAWHRNQAYV